MEDLSELLLDVQTSIANMQLPDPALRQYYIDLENREYWITGDIDDSLLTLVRLIIDCNKEDAGVEVNTRKPIKIFINSNGGDIQILWTVINAIRVSKTPVYTINTCAAYSAAAYLMASGHKRYALPGTNFMLHSGSRCYSGDADQVDSTKKYFDRLSKKLINYFISKVNIDNKTYKKKTVTDWFFDEEDALSIGLIDKVVDDLDEICVSKS